MYTDVICNNAETRKPDKYTSNICVRAAAVSVHVK